MSEPEFVGWCPVSDLPILRGDDPENRWGEARIDWNAIGIERTRRARRALLEAILRGSARKATR